MNLFPLFEDPYLLGLDTIGDMRGSDDFYSQLDILMRLYNKNLEDFILLDQYLTTAIMSHPLFRTAEEALEEGVIVELGSYKGTTLWYLGQQFAEKPKVLVVGLDNRHYNLTPSPKGFKKVDLHVLLDAEKRHGIQLFDHDVLGDSDFPIEPLIFQHEENPNAYLIYDIRQEDILIPDARVDLIFLKTMLAYFGSDGQSPLDHFRDTILRMAERVFVTDYVGGHNQTLSRIPSPETIADVVSNAFQTTNVKMTQGDNHFVLYASR